MTTLPKVYNYKILKKVDLNSFNLSLKKPWKTKYGYYQMDIEKLVNEKNRNVFFQSPIMNIIKDVYPINNKKAINIEFNKNSDNKQFFEFLTKFDDFIVDYLHLNFENWFSKKLSKSTIKRLYNRKIR